MQIYRQGDVLLVKLEKNLTKKQVKEKLIPVEPKDGKLILAEGEATGHHHFIPEHNAMLGMLGVSMILRVIQENTKLMHQEHDEVILPIGDYQVVRQQEYTPQEIRRVTD